ncbi:MAG: phosphoenolpyruvate--protein phosphotransferase [Oscillospiraceae bacterium]|nr:phosphoenolpyruvate--protein phosphotransferase [Oscillospiraceae bacterium]
MNILKGIAVSQGIAIGQVYRYSPFKPTVEERYCRPDEAAWQAESYQNSKESALGELRDLFDKMMRENSGKADIFKAHQDIITDEVIDGEILAGIHSENMHADFAVFSVLSGYIDILGQSEDSLIRERVMDLTDVRSRLIRNLHGVREQSLSHFSEPTIVVAEDLFPSDTATIDRTHVVGIATELGGATSHTAIIAKSYGIPAIVGIPSLMQEAAGGAQAVIDALAGALIISPTPDLCMEYVKKLDDFLEVSARTQKFVSTEAITKDGIKIDIGMNIGSAKLPEFSEFADFIGLFRTEFLYMESSQMPTEQAQYEAYRSVLEAAGKRPVTLRTLDIGGDKKLDYWQLPQEENPFLGNRALRLCFAYEDVFKAQLRAALRASIHGVLHIMFPMVGSIEDVRRAKTSLESAKADLSRAGIPYSPDVKVGIMIEIPSVAACADKFAAEVDFASIGTNDLTQYLFAVDRMNPRVERYYQEFSPLLIHCLSHIVTAFGSAQKPLSICGELGGNPDATALLVGLGLRKLSMNSSSFAAVRQVITQIEYAQAAGLAQNALAASTEDEVKALIRAFHKKLHPEAVFL